MVEACVNYVCDIGGDAADAALTQLAEYLYTPNARTRRFSWEAPRVMVRGRR